MMIERAMMPVVSAECGISVGVGVGVRSAVWSAEARTGENTRIVPMKRAVLMMTRRKIRRE
jgi:hypothetical protein